MVIRLDVSCDAVLSWTTVRADTVVRVVIEPLSR